MYFPRPYIEIALNGYAIGLPKWFVTSYEPYLKMAEHYKKLEEQRISTFLGNGKPDFERWKIVRSAVWDQINSEKAPLIADLYIKTVDEFENSRWPTKYAVERDISIYFCNHAIYAFYKDRKAPISDNLADAIILNRDACQAGYVSVSNFVKAGFVRNAKSADFLASILFCDRLGGSSLKFICEWIKCKWINPKKYINQMSQFVGSPYLEGKSNGDSARRELLDAVKSVNILVYGKLAQVFDSEIRRFNLKSFDSYKRDRDNFPKDFIAYPFADGTRMRPERSLFSWQLR